MLRGWSEIKCCEEGLACSKRQVPTQGTSQETIYEFVIAIHETSGNGSPGGSRMLRTETHPLGQHISWPLPWAEDATGHRSKQHSFGWPIQRRKRWERCIQPSFSRRGPSIAALSSIHGLCLISQNWLMVNGLSLVILHPFGLSTRPTRLGLCWSRRGATATGWAIHTGCPGGIQYTSQAQLLSMWNS